MIKRLDIRAVINKTQEYLPSETLALIEDAYEFASQVLEKERAESARVELEHAVKTAVIVAELQLDEYCIAAALLHELPQKCGVSLSEIKKRFGTETSKLVEGLVKLEKVSLPAAEEVKAKRPSIWSLRRKACAGCLWPSLRTSGWSLSSLPTGYTTCER